MRALPVLALCLFATSARADLIPDGKKPYFSEVVLENLGDFPQYAVVAYPTGFSNGRPDEPQAELLAPGAPFSPSGRWHKPELVAIAREDLGRGDLASMLGGAHPDGGAAPLVYHSGVEVPPRTVVDESTPGNGTRTTYHIASISQGRLELVQVSQVTVDLDGHPVQPRPLAGSKRWIFAFAFLGPLAGLGLLALAMRRRHPAPPTAPPAAPPPEATSNGDAPKGPTQ